MRRYSATLKKRKNKGSKIVSSDEMLINFGGGVEET
jgi:hypothetical protein